MAWQGCYLLPGRCYVVTHGGHDLQGVGTRSLSSPRVPTLFPKDTWTISRCPQGSFPSAHHSRVPQGRLPQIVSFQLITNVLASHSIPSLRSTSGSLETFRPEAGPPAGGMDSSFSMVPERGKGPSIGAGVGNVCTSPRPNTSSPTPGSSDQDISSFPVLRKSAVAGTCLSLCNPMDCSPPGFSVHGFLQTRILEWVAFPSPGNLLNSGIKPGSLSSPASEGCCFFVFCFPPPLHHLGSPHRGRLLWDRTILGESGPSRPCRICLCFLLMPLTVSLLLVCGVLGNCLSSDKIPRSSALCLLPSLSWWTRRK